MKRILAVLLACALLPILPLPARAEASTTVMVYMCGSNLESQYGLASADIDEMLGADFDAEHTTVLLMLSGAQRWDLGFDADATSICEIGRRGLRVLETRERMNMGEGDTLAYFLNYAWEARPADRYMLIVWDHGGGPLHGVCWDENYAPDNLSMQELTGALAESPFARRKLDMIGFDACLMGSLEVAWMVSPYAEYMTASEEMEPGGGWDYSFLRGLERDATMEDAGRRIVDAYAESGSGESALTLACIDLGAIPKVEGAMSSYFFDLQQSKRQPSFAELSAARRASTDFGRDFRGYDSTGYDLVDLKSLLGSCEKYGPGTGGALEAAIDEAVVYSRSNVEGSSGLSIYFPFYNAGMYRSSGRDQYMDMNFCPGYTSYMQKFGAYLLGDAPVSWAGIATQAERGASGAEIHAQLTPEQAAEAASVQLVVFESQEIPGSANSAYRMIYSSDEVELDGEGRLSASYDDEVLVFTLDLDGYRMSTTAVPYQIMDTGEYVVEVVASDRDDDTVWNSSLLDAYGLGGDSRVARLVLSPPDELGKLALRRVYVYDALTDSFTTRTNFHLTDYKWIHSPDRRRIPVADADGALLPFDEWEATQNSAHANGTSVAFESRYEWNCEILRAPFTWRYAAFQITDNQNNVHITAPVRFDDGSVTFADARAEVQDSNLISVEPRCALVGDTLVCLYVEVTNRTVVPLDAALLVNRVNGAPFTGAYSPGFSTADSYDAPIAPGETFSLAVAFGDSDFGNDQRLTQIEFEVRCAPVNANVPADVVHGELQLDEDITRYINQEPSVLFDPDPLEPDSPVLYDDGTVRARLNGARVTRDSVILAVTCENAGESDARLCAWDGGLDGASALFRNWVAGVYGWKPRAFDSVEIPAGGSALTYFELLRGAGGADGVERVALRLGPDPEGAGGIPVEVALPEEVAFGAEQAQFPGAQLRVS